MNDSVLNSMTIPKNENDTHLQDKENPQTHPKIC